MWLRPSHPFGAGKGPLNVVPRSQQEYVAVICRPLAVVAFGFLALPALADPGLECSQNASSQAEIGGCIVETEALANASLAQVLEWAFESARELDEVTGRVMVVPALEASQAAWEAHRDAHCEFLATTYGGGSGTGIAIGSCRIEMARDRLDELMATVN